MSNRRTLDYARIDSIMPDVDRLLQSHTTSGRWTLGQILDHLDKAIRLTAHQPRRDTPPPAPTPEQDAVRTAFFAARSMPEGRDVPTPRLVPNPDAEPRASADSLRGAINVIVAFEGPLPVHPVLGPLTRDEWLQFHCVHCAHHLSFAHPA